MHNLALPPFEPAQDFDPAGYLTAVADAVSTEEGWEVLPDDVVLGFFSFAKFLMYRDLEPENWPEGARVTEQPIRSLLSDRIETHTPVSDDVLIDRHIAPADMLHIVDSDSSQTLAIHDVRRGRDLVIQVEWVTPSVRAAPESDPAVPRPETAAGHPNPVPVQPCKELPCPYQFRFGVHPKEPINDLQLENVRPQSPPLRHLLSRKGSPLTAAAGFSRCFRGL